MPRSRLEVRVASPCPARWDEMVGDDQQRHCLLCEKMVYNLSAMSREKVDALRAGRGDICVRFYRREDGTVMTTNCPVGLRRVRRMSAMLVGLVFAMFAGVIVMLGSSPDSVRRLRSCGYALAWWIAPEEKPEPEYDKPYDGVSFDKADECHFTAGLDK